MRIASNATSLMIPTMSLRLEAREFYLETADPKVRVCAARQKWSIDAVCESDLFEGASVFTGGKA
jgi:hypothetical protein